MNPVPIESLRQVWPSVRPMLEKLSSRANWLPEDIYVEVAQGRARLFVGNNSVLVAVPKEEEFTHKKVLHIWVGVNEGDDFDSCLAWVKQHAKEFGFSKITFDSVRDGWKKRFTVESISYRIEL